MGMAPKATESLKQCASQKGMDTMENNMSDEAKKIAAAALAAVKDDAANAASGRGKIAVSIPSGLLCFVGGLKIVFIGTNVHYVAK